MEVVVVELRSEERVPVHPFREGFEVVEIFLIDRGRGFSELEELVLVP